MKEIELGTDFSGIGAAEYAIGRVASKKSFKVKNIFACEMDKFARKSYLANHSAPIDFPYDVYEREILEKSLDIYVSSPPCQGFSLAGKREGSVLFLNTHEFIQKNLPRFFIIENVKGLLSHEKGRTFNQWITLLGGKSVNGTIVMAPYHESAPYHIYYKVMNAKKHGVPQNRERIFIVGIRDDKDNNFSFPKETELAKRLKDVLEENVPENYYLSDKTILSLLTKENNFNGDFEPQDGDDIGKTITSGYGKTRRTETFIKEPNIIQINNPIHSNNRVYSDEGVAPTLSAMEGGNRQPFIIQKGRGYNKGGNHPESPPITSNSWDHNNYVVIPDDVIQLNPSKESNNQQPFKQNRVYSSEGVSPALDTECGRPNYCVPVSSPDIKVKKQNGRRFKNDGQEMFTLTAQDRHGIYDGYRIRRLTPLECCRLMDFPDSHNENSKKAKVSETQLYKQYGNSIVIKCLELIIENLNL